MGNKTVNVGSSYPDNEDYIVEDRGIPDVLSKKMDSGKVETGFIHYGLADYLRRTTSIFSREYWKPPAESSGAVSANWLLYNEDISTAKEYVFKPDNFNLTWSAPRVLKFKTAAGKAFNITVSGIAENHRYVTETVALNGETEVLTKHSYMGSIRNEDLLGPLSGNPRQVFHQAPTIKVTGASGYVLYAGLSKWFGCPCVVIDESLSLLHGRYVVEVEGGYGYSYEGDINWDDTNENYVDMTVDTADATDIVFRWGDTSRALRNQVSCNHWCPGSSYEADGDTSYFVRFLGSWPSIDDWLKRSF